MHSPFETEVVRQVRAREPIARGDLARLLAVAPSTVGRNVDRLVSRGVLMETGLEAGAAGRPKILLQLNPEYGRFIGVDFEAGSLFAVATDFARHVVARESRTLKKGIAAAEVLQLIEETVETLCDVDPHPVYAVGIGVPGRVNPGEGIAVGYPYIKGWKDIPLADRLCEKFGLPVFLQNNIRSMALAERLFGAGRGSDDLVCIGVRTGISAGVVLKGELLTGRHNIAGEIRGWVVPGEFGGGRLEDTGSLPALLSDAECEGMEHFKEALAGERAGAREALRRIAKLHGWAISQLSQLIDPEKIILAGPLASLGDAYVETVRESAKEYLKGLYSKSPPILVSPLGEFNGAMGAAAVASHHWEPVAKS